MIKKTVFVVVILIILFSILFLRNKTEPMVNPAVVPQPPAEINQPEVMKYDVSTDLQKELDSVNPQINDSDF
ncbi:MAG: hypothetical protein Q7R77_04190 [Candidatus Daviesbacteria bacterium]|nr:hypothetical protein [Candidatus Daviesbacteria bacterium]